jgi:hypothetical protein
LVRCSGDIEENSLSITPIARSIPQVASGSGNNLLSHTCQARRSADDPTDWIDKIEDRMQNAAAVKQSKDSVSSLLHLGCHITITTAMPLTGYHWVCTHWPSFTNRYTKKFEKR